MKNRNHVNQCHYLSDAGDTVSLRTNLMESYDPKVPPRSSDNGPIKILMGLTLTHFLLVYIYTSTHLGRD